MSKNNKPLSRIIINLKERAKELNCLYRVQELLNTPDASVDDICSGVIEAIPPGLQFPDVCQAKIIYRNKIYQTADFKETPWVQCAEIRVQDELVGKLSIFYTEERPPSYKGPFLKEELKLINTIADQLGLYILHQQLKSVFKDQKQSEKGQKSEWWTILDLLKRTDPRLLIRLSRKMINYLFWIGIKEAKELLELFSPEYKEESELLKEINKPYQRHADSNVLSISYDVFEVAARHLSELEILGNIQKWIKEDRSGFMVNILENPGSSLAEISTVIERYHHLAPQGLELSTPREKSFRVSLIRCLLSDQPGFINIAKQFINVEDFNNLTQNIIFPVGSHGKIGGKGAGLFLAKRILETSFPDNELFNQIKIPRTWYLTSDGILNFMSYNNLEDIMEQKYKDIGQVRQEYPYVVHVFKNSLFVPEIIKGLSLALDDFGEVPLIVRSSSLLEDRMGAAFAGKYKSLFIANQGSKEQRLEELMDAIAEVYASIFGPDPIEYRAEHGLLDYHEEMGILIQEVVGKKIGHYFLPAFAGVAFSHNEFRWSSRIKREDGLIRVVPGLGTRAVDRLSDDYPILIAPGQPKMRVNVTIDEIVRYSPKSVDVINLKTKSFETISILTLLKDFGDEYPIVNRLVSVLQDNHIQQHTAFGMDFSKDNIIVTFEGLITRTPFVKQMHSILDVLQEEYKRPIDIEFAHDGENLYLLQCRSQSYASDSAPASIPRDTPEEKVIFSANRFVSNGSVQDITHIVYVSPQKYSEISDYHEMLSVGKAIGRLNKILPKRQFILMGPGRWGSRGDIKLGVSVTYSEISNTSMLIEIARKKKDYVPDLSFGTHFFQDLVEANIRYLPLYPDETGNIFNDNFLENSDNILIHVLPDSADLSDVIRVIDVSSSTNGNILKVLMNADEEEAVGILTEPSETTELEIRKKESLVSTGRKDVHWRWRLRNIEGLASRLDPERFNVKAFYIFGSTKNGTAGPGSDIDILIHFDGTDKQRNELLIWLEGWSQSLSQMNYLRTGYKTDGLLDIHLVTNEDIEKHTSYAAKIGAVSDAARPLAIGTALKSSKL